jgi:hypothetical protein
MWTSPPRMLAAAISVIGLILLMTGCEHGTTPAGGGATTPASARGPSGAPSTATASFDGTWSGTWTRVTPPTGSGTYTWVLHQQGQQITGTLDARSSACLTNGPLTGHVSGTHITLHAITPAVNGVGEAKATYHGILAAGTLSGTGVVRCSVGVGFATWKLTRH